MSTLGSSILVPGLLFLLTLASGVWLSHAGKPLNSLIFTIHKLIALGAAVAIAAQVGTALKSIEIQAGLIALVIFAGLCVLALFVTGALMSMKPPVYASLLITHKAASVLAVIAAAAAANALTTGRIF